MSLKQPVWHVLVLSALTLKLYFIYWCYKNWRDLCRQKLNDAAILAEETTEAANISRDDLLAKLLPDHLSSFEDCSPFLRALMVAVPYVNNYMFFTLVLGIAKLHPDKGSFVSKHPFICSITILISWISLSLLAFLPGALYFLFLLSIVPMAIAQHWLNKYWDSKEEGGLSTRHRFSFKETIVIIAGALILGYIASSFIIGH